MRELTPIISKTIESHIGEKLAYIADPYPAETYSDLVKHIAELAYLNKDTLLFFRGQIRDYQSKSNSSTFYPTIYRDRLEQREINYRFEKLNEASRQLVELFAKHDITGHRELRRKKYIQWSIIQHYNVCETPLIDFTHSIRVASSFAQLDSEYEYGYVYVFGLPYITNRISINSEHDIVLVRLLSICPPSALRPYFQEGYLCGTEDITTEYRDKTELDFKHRLIAKFRIPNDDSFWGKRNLAIDRDDLYPENDQVAELCKSIEIKVEEEFLQGQFGIFIKAWTKLESQLIDIAQNYTSETYTTSSAINTLVKMNIIDQERYSEYARIKKFRNKLVHEPEEIDPQDIEKYIDLINFFQISTR